MKKLLLFLTFVLAVSITNAQPLAGTKTIGSTGDYVDISSAVSALNANGISADVTFNIQSSATAYVVSNLNITTFTGHNLFNVTFQSESGNASDVKIENISSDLYLFHCYGADNISFKNLSLKTNSSLWSNIFMLDYDADNITIENCKLTGNYNGSAESQYSLIYVDDFIASDNTNCDNLIVRNCLLDGGKAAITVNGNSSGGGNIRNLGLKIENDSIVNQKEYGINIDYCSSFSVRSNFIKPTTIASPTSMFAGINLNYCDGLYKIENNIISIVNANPVGNLYGIFIEFSNHVTLTSNLNFGTIQNNMIHLNGGSSGSDAIGIVIQDCNYTRLLHNTIRTTADGSESYCVKFNSSADIVFKNNLLQVGTLPLLFNKDGATTISSDYNVYFGFDAIGTINNGSTFSLAVNPLVDWQTYSSLDTNSIYKQVTFFGDYSTLELSAQSVADATIRVPQLALVTNDIYGKTRQNPTCAGAYDRHGPLSGTYYIDNTAPNPTPARTFRSFNKAVQALASGVNGATEFVAKDNTTYYENISIPIIDGSSLINDITFTSDGFQTTVLSYNASNSMDNYIVQLDSTAFITFSNLVFSHPETSIFGRVFDITNGAKFVNIRNNTFYGNASPTSIPSQSGLITISGYYTNPDNIIIENNTMNNGENAVKVTSVSTLFQNIQIKKNSLNYQARRGLDLKNVKDVVIENNYISKPFQFTNTTYSGIYCEYCEGNAKINANFINISAASFSLMENIGINLQFVNPSITTLTNMGEITNNMIRVKNDAPEKSAGIYLGNTGFKKVFHNTIVNTSLNSSGIAMSVSSLTDTIDIQNNIFQCFSSSTAFSAANSLDINTIRNFDYNNFHTSSGNLSSVAGTPQFTLAQLITATGNKNNNSISDTVVYVDPLGSPADLHLSDVSVTNNNLKAIPVSGVLLDYDGELRNATTPFMGADEGCQNALTLTPIVVGTHTSCNGFPLVSATPNYGGQIKWYTTATGGNGTFFPPQGATGTYTLWASEKQGYCETPRVAVTIINNPAAEITVIAKVNSTTVSDGKLFLFKQNIINNRMDTIRVENITSSTYTFTGLYPGNYLIYFKPNKTTYPNTPGRFNGDVVFWENTSFLNIACSSNNTYTINANSIAAITGPGLISGKVQKGVKFGKTNTVGDPIPGVDISLEQNPGGIMVSQTETDVNGNYSFSNLPLDDYRIRVNIPGTPHSAYYDISIDNTTPSKTDLVYVVDSAEIYPLSDNVNINNADAKNSFKVIPNPFDKEAQLVLPNEWKNTNQELLITITDISGKIVYSKNCNSNTQVIINRENLENGMYFVKLMNDTKSSVTKIMIVD